MKKQCIDAVNAVYGREATDAEITAIKQRIGGAMKARAQRDRQAWLATPHHEKVATAARDAAESIRREAEETTRRQALQVVAIARLQAQVAAFPGTPLEGLARVIAFHADARGSAQSMETRAKAIFNDSMRQMTDTLTATNPKFFGLFERPEGVRDLVRELLGEATGNKDAANGAAEFKAIAEANRQRFNRGGGRIGFREDWGMPHHHSQLRVARAGQDAWRASLPPAERARAWLKDQPPPPEYARTAWVAEVMPKLNREKYVHEDGTAMDDVEVADMLRHAWTTIATGGYNKLTPGATVGKAMVANRGDESRQVHFQNADAYLDYQAKYGEKTAFDVIVGHLQGLARDIAAVETFGPNPDHAYRLLRDQAMQQMVLDNPATMGKLRNKAFTVDALFNMAIGRTLPVASERMAKFFDNMRSMLVANRLGSAVLTSVTDEGTMMRMAAVNNLPQMKLWANELRAFNLADQDEKRFANRAGLGLNTLVAAVNRFGNEQLGASWMAKVATGTLRASGLNAMTEARRRAFGTTMMSAYGKVARDAVSLASLNHYDHRVMLSKGITDTDFAVWRRAELEDWGHGNDTMLTPDAIARIPDERLAGLGDPQVLREEAITKLLGAVLEETDMAVIEPGLRERVITKANLQRGTLSGELARSAWLFKSFPLAMIMKHWQRALSEPTPVQRIRALTALTTSTTVLGMVALQAANLRDGKDPADMTDLRTWGAAMLKGGALSIFGDYLFSQQSQSGRGLVASMLGPVFSLGEESLALTWGNAIEAAQGEETDLGAELVRYAKYNTPGVSALVNLWYFRAAVDHLLMHDLQELLSPGYLQRMKSRGERDFGTTYWWEPGGSPFIDASGEDFAPERAPDLKKTVGAQQ